MKIKLLFLSFLITANAFAQVASSQTQDFDDAMREGLFESVSYVDTAIVTSNNDKAVISSKSDEFPIQINEFTISPNPGKNKLNIKLPSKGEDLKLEVFDVLGKRIYKGLITELKASIDVSRWKSGVYLVKVSNDKITKTKRFIKQ